MNVTVYVNDEAVEVRTGLTADEARAFCQHLIVEDWHGVNALIVSDSERNQMHSWLRGDGWISRELVTQYKRIKFGF